MRRRWLIGGAAGVAAALGVAVRFVFFRDDAPAEVDLTAGNEQLDEDLAAATPDEGGDDAVAPTFDGDIDGTWVIDDEIGSFDFQTASGSFAGFRVAVDLTIGKTTAVGRSGGVSGSITIAGGALTTAEVIVDVTTIESDDSRRSAIRRAIGADEFPTATFALSAPVDLSAGLADGEQVTVSAVGDLTVKGTTNPVTFRIDANVRDDGFGVITGSTGIVWEDFGVSAPSSEFVLSVADEGTVEFQLVLAKG